MVIADVISLLGGLAFFLYGMSLMGDSMKKVAGNRLETILSQLTSHRLKAIALGAVVTAVIQSSSATSVMAVGFVNSGLMKLGQAIGIIMGANIGTTVTGWLLTLAGIEESTGLFSSSSMFALAAFVGIVLHMFGRGSVKKNIGVLLIAFSLLMTGMKMMSAAVAPLQESPLFLNAITMVSNPLLGVLVGTLFTAIIQSNSASVGILQALAVTGAVTWDMALPLVLGMNIGACAPVLLSAITANKNGRRTSIIYLYYNLVGTMVFMALFYGLHAIVQFSFFQDPLAPWGVAIINTVFNFSATVILTPFIGALERMAVATFPDSEEDEEFEENLLDERFLGYPPLALEQCGKTVERMASASVKNLERAMELFQNFNPEKFEKIMARETAVDRYEDRLGNYLVRLNSQELSQRETLVTSEYLHCLTNLERISDHAVSLAQLAEEVRSKGMTFSPDGQRDIRRCIEAVRDIVTLAQQALTEENMEIAQQVEPLEEVISTLLESVKTGHIRRLQRGECTLEMGFVFNDCINNFERVAAHCSNIALAVLEVQNSDLQFHDYTRGIRQGDQPEFRKWLDFYQKKYLHLPSPSGQLV